MRAAKPDGPVVVVGSLHHDIVVRADRQPMRGETLMGHEWFPKFGGKGGNQAVAASKLGAETHMIGAVGRDAFAEDLIAGLERAGVNHEAVARVSKGSGMSVATIDRDGDYAAVVVSGANTAIDPGAVSSAKVFERTAVLLLQNEVPPEVNLCAAQAAQAVGAVVLWNAAPMRPDPEGLLNLVDLLIVNAVEAEQLCGQSVSTLDEAEAAAVALSDMGSSAVVTAGAAGCAWSTSDGLIGRLPARLAENPQSHGAGDVFCGALAANLPQRSLEESLKAASEQAFRHVSGFPIGS